MAYVAISKDLIEAVRRNIDSMRAAEAKLLPDGTTDWSQLIHTDPAAVELIERKLWGSDYDLRERLRSRDRMMYVDLQISYSMEDGSARKDELRVNSFPTPCWTNTGSYSSYVDVNGLSENDHEIFKRFCDIQRNKRESTERWDKVKTQVANFISAAKSLNEAIKLWPDLRRYIPKEYLDRVDKKAEKSAATQSKAAEALAALDMDAINTSTVLARMGGAKV